MPPTEAGGFYVCYAMKKLFLIAALACSTLAVFGQNKAQKARIKEVEQLYANAESLLQEQSENAQLNWFVKSNANINEAAVGVMTYDAMYYPFCLIDPSTPDFLRLTRSMGDLWSDFYEVLYGMNEDCPVTLFCKKEYSYQPVEGEYDDLRIYWYDNGKVCYIEKEHVSLDGKHTPVKLDDDDKKGLVKYAIQFASIQARRHQVFFENDEAEEDYDEGEVPEE